MSANNLWTGNGFVCSDPEIKTLEGGTAVVGFRLRLERSTKKDGKWGKKSVFYSVQMWGRQAESFHSLIKKGDPVSLFGELDFDEWTDDQGNKQYKSFLTALGWNYVPRPREEKEQVPF